MNEAVKVLVVDDHPLVAQATRQLLEQMERIQVVGMAGNGKACMDMVAAHNPDIVFLDYQLPDIMGSKLAEQIKRDYPDVRIIVFTGIDITDLFNYFIEIKVSGIISKESSEAAIRNMVLAVMDNHTVLPLSLFHQMRLLSNKPEPELALTGEEVKIMALVVKGATHEQVADRIHASKRSVDNYLRKIYDKLGVKSKAQAIEAFIQSKHYTDGG
jgi:two-component system competent response regulator ComA